MRKNQRVLLKALESITNSVLCLEDAQKIVNEMTKEEVIEVVNKFSDKTIAFDENSLYADSYNFQGLANSIINDVVKMIGDC